MDDLERAGMIVTADPGGKEPLAAHSHAYVTGVFGKILPVEAIYPGIVGAAEDLVVLRKRDVRAWAPTHVNKSNVPQYSSRAENDTEG